MFDSITYRYVYNTMVFQFENQAVVINIIIVDVSVYMVKLYWLLMFIGAFVS